MTWFWLNMPLAALFFAAWCGIPMWLVLRHPDEHHKPVTKIPARAARAARAAPVAAIDQTSGLAPSPGIQPAGIRLAVPR